MAGIRTGSLNWPEPYFTRIDGKVVGKVLEDEPPASSLANSPTLTMGHAARGSDSGHGGVHVAGCAQPHGLSRVLGHQQLTNEQRQLAGNVWLLKCRLYDDEIGGFFS